MTLARDLVDGPVRLVPWDSYYVEGLRASCARDPDIWDIYPVNMVGDYFDRVIEQRMALHRADKWVPFICLKDGEVVGTTNYIDPDPRQGVVEIGGTYLEPSVRGSGYNRELKRMMIEHAFSEGFTRIEFRIDTRNTRSMRAVEKLGAAHEGTLRKNKTTWTGYRRDTAVFGLLAKDWQAAAQPR